MDIGRHKKLRSQPIYHISLFWKKKKRKQYLSMFMVKIKWDKVFRRSTAVSHPRRWIQLLLCRSTIYTRVQSNIFFAACVFLSKKNWTPNRLNSGWKTNYMYIIFFTSSLEMMNIICVGSSKIGCVSVVSWMNLHLFCDVLNREASYKCQVSVVVSLATKDLLGGLGHMPGCVGVTLCKHSPCRLETKSGQY